MFDRIASRWWLIILSLVFCIGATVAVNYNQPPLYIGRTTLIETERALTGSAALVQSATSNHAIRDALETLRDIGSKHDDVELMRAISIQEVKGKPAVSVYVALPDPAESRRAESVVAASVKKAWDELYGQKACNGCRAVVTRIGQTTVVELRFTSAKQARVAARPVSLARFARNAISIPVLADACRTMRDLGSGHTPQELLAVTSVQPIRGTNILSVEVALSDPMEAKMAADVMGTCVRRAYNAQNGAAIGGSLLKTVDPAYVQPVNRRHALRGLVKAVGAGLVIGILLAALLPTASRR